MYCHIIFKITINLITRSHSLSLLQEIEDLKLDLFETEQQKDRTPGALIFFSIMYDPGAVSAMQTMLFELRQLRGVAECKEHLEFSVLRRKILVCLANTPAVERLLGKFSKLHSSWTQSRAKMFSVRNQVGGDADSSYACPLCDHDSREISESVPKSSKRNKTKVTSEKASSNLDSSLQPATLGTASNHGRARGKSLNPSKQDNSIGDQRVSMPVLPQLLLPMTPTVDDLKKSISNKIKVHNW